MVVPWRQFRGRVTRVLHLNEEPRRLAMGMAVGVFIGITPFYGLHTLLAIAVAAFLRLNKAAAVTGAWINLPWFAPFVYGFCFKLGKALLSGQADAAWPPFERLAEAARAWVQATPGAHEGSFWQLLWAMMFEASMPLFVGTSVFGLALAIVTYLITLKAVRNIRYLGTMRGHTLRASDGSPPPQDPRP